MRPLRCLCVGSRGDERPCSRPGGPVRIKSCLLVPVSIAWWSGCPRHLCLRHCQHLAGSGPGARPVRLPAAVPVCQPRPGAGVAGRVRLRRPPAVAPAGWPDRARLHHLSGLPADRQGRRADGHSIRRPHRCRVHPARRKVSTAAVVHLVRYGSGRYVPWEVVGTGDTTLTPDGTWRFPGGSWRRCGSVGCDGQPGRDSARTSCGQTSKGVRRMARGLPADPAVEQHGRAAGALPPTRRAVSEAWCPLSSRAVSLRVRPHGAAGDRTDSSREV